MAVKLENFTPLLDEAVEEIGFLPAAILGLVWRFEQRRDGVCKAAQANLAKYLGLDRATVNRHLRQLCEDGYIVDLTPDATGVPHEYRLTGKIEFVADIRATYTPKSQGVSQKRTGGVAENDTRKLEEETRKETISRAKRENCSKCQRPTETGPGIKLSEVCDCNGRAEMERHLGPSTPRTPAETKGHWSDRGKEPWMTEYGDVRPRNGISAASLKRVRWLIEKYTSLKPVGKELKGWWAACADIHEGGRGDWRAIEEGIKRAWNRKADNGRDYRPRHPRGFVGEVQLSYGDLSKPRTKAAGRVYE